MTAAALAASTRPRTQDRAAARSAGSVAVGDTADLAVVDLDPLAAAPEALRTTPVALTLLAGRPTHRTL